MSLAPRKSVREQVDPAQHVPVDPNDFVGDAAKEIVRLTPKAIEMAKQALVKRGTPEARCSALRILFETPKSVRRFMCSAWISISAFNVSST